jgi:hypothetical protein
MAVIQLYGNNVQANKNIIVHWSAPVMAAFRQ